MDLPNENCIGALHSCKNALDHSIRQIEEGLKRTDAVHRFDVIKNQTEILCLDLMGAAQLIYDVRSSPRPPTIIKTADLLEELATSIRFTLKMLIDVYRTV